MSTTGVDYAWGRPGGAELAAAGVQFAARYLSHDTTGKTLDRAEAEDLQSHGVAVVAVFEDGAKRPLDGYQAGKDDAAFAAALAADCGMPADRPIYFAADWDVAENEQATLNSYLQGAADILGGSDRVGVYGGYYAVSRALDAGVCTWGWQTTGWSGGQWEYRAQLRQDGGTVTIGGVECDQDVATADDYGQWHPSVVAPAWPGRYLRLTSPEMHGNDAAEWQARMVDRGWNLGASGADGVFGPITDQVCRQFQADKRLQVDGIIGPRTWGAAWTTPVTP